MDVGEPLHLAPVKLEFSTKCDPKFFMPMLNLQFSSRGNGMHIKKKEEFAKNRMGLFKIVRNPFKETFFRRKKSNFKIQMS